MGEKALSKPFNARRPIVLLTANEDSANLRKEAEHDRSYS
jgi:hypothetical protein